MAALSSCFLVCRLVMSFADVKDVKAHLVSLDCRYGRYAENIWSNEIWSLDAIRNSSKEDLAIILAHPGPPGPSHAVHASDIIARSQPDAGTLK